MPTAPITSLPAVQAPPSTAGGAPRTHDMRLKDTARQFESMFMTEMLRHTRPANQAAGPFAAGKAEETWRVLMDQALGQAATTNPAADRGSLRQAIEKSLRDADAHSTKGLSK